MLTVATCGSQNFFYYFLIKAKQTLNFISIQRKPIREKYCIRFPYIIDLIPDKYDSKPWIKKSIFFVQVYSVSYDYLCTWNMVQKCSHSMHEFNTFFVETNNTINEWFFGVTQHLNNFDWIVVHDTIDVFFN